jgi:formyl-CoA transferase
MPLNNNCYRVGHREALVSQLATLFRARSNAEWCRRFAGASFPYGPVNDMEQVFADPQVRHNQLEQQMEHTSLGTIRQVRARA